MYLEDADTTHLAEGVLQIHVVTRCSWRDVHLVTCSVRRSMVRPSRARAAFRSFTSLAASAPSSHFSPLVGAAVTVWLPPTAFAKTNDGRDFFACREKKGKA